MSASAHQQDAAVEQQGRALIDHCREAIAALDQALQAQPGRLGNDDLDSAERAVARLRDGLIDRLREDGASVEAQRLRTALNEVNVALSLIVGVAYPAVGIKRTFVAQARDSLQNLLARGVLTKHSGYDQNGS